MSEEIDVAAPACYVGRMTIEEIRRLKLLAIEEQIRERRAKRSVQKWLREKKRAAKKLAHDRKWEVDIKPAGAL